MVSPNEATDKPKSPCGTCWYWPECGSFFNGQLVTSCKKYLPIGSAEKTNAVNHPTHYNQGDIECIDAMVSAFGAEKVAVFCRINAFKYVWRMANKNGLEDAKKAVWYLNKHIELKERMADDSD